MDGTVTEELRARASADADAAVLEQLAVAARDGGDGAFGELARRLTGRLMAVAVRLLGDRSLAEEAVQEAFVRIYRFLPRYREGNVASWCFAIVHRTCSDIRRREQRHPIAEIVDVAAHGDPMDAVDLRAAVEHAVARIPTALRDTFVLHQQGLSYDDIARVLDIPIGTVRSRLHEARRLLRVMLAGALQADEGRNA